MESGYQFEFKWCKNFVTLRKCKKSNFENLTRYDPFAKHRRVVHGNTPVGMHLYDEQTDWDSSVNHGSWWKF